METAAQSIKVHLQQFPVRAPDELESAFDRMVQGHMEAVGISDDGMLNANVGRIAALTTKRRLLSIGNLELAQAGGLIGYGASATDSYRQAGVYVGRILKGDKAADLPVLQPVKFDLAINLRTVKTLNITISPSVLGRADSVIE
jgi:putative ABC transport system substrate-binding protein